MCVYRSQKKNTVLEECKASLADVERRAHSKAQQDAKVRSVCGLACEYEHPINYCSTKTCNIEGKALCWKVHVSYILEHL